MKKHIRALSILTALMMVFPTHALMQDVSEQEILSEEAGKMDSSLITQKDDSYAVISTGSDGEHSLQNGEEEMDSLTEVMPGAYEWYIIPTEPVEGHAYIDIYPEESPAFPEVDELTGQIVWNYSFIMNNTSEIEFTPTFVNIIPFWDNGFYGTSRDQWCTYYAEELPLLIGGTSLPGGSTCYFRAQSTDSTICSLAISITGKDALGMEMEFHSMVLISQEARPVSEY